MAKYHLICTSYTDYTQTGQGLVLRNNWIEEIESDEQMLETLARWQLSDDFKYPSRGSVSNILCGKMEIDKVVIHARVIRF